METLSNLETGVASARSGLVAGGNFIMDYIKVIDVYPQQDALASILSESCANGGGAYNVLIDLAHMGAPFPLGAIGLVGDDRNGKLIREDCESHDIDTSLLHVTSAAATSYTDAMSVKSTGRRTFFHRRGANAMLNVEHFDFSRTRAKVFHLGYLLLLDSLDLPDESYGTVAAGVLQNAGAHGLITSIDVVSEDSARFPQIVLPALRHVDYAFLNEFEAGRCVGSEIRSGEKLCVDTLVDTAEKLLRYGVKQAVIIHFPEGAFALQKDGQKFWRGSVNLPAEKISGATGAGDAFAAGVLYGVHESRSMQESLKLGVCGAAASLQHPTASSGIPHLQECLQLAEEHGYRTIEP